jgi:preprotein translocase subunit YajC
MDLFLTAMAQAGETAARQPSLVDALILPAGIFVILYFFMIRPQQRKMKEHKDFLTSMKVGDEVVTGGGIIGTIRSIADTFVSLEVSANTNIKVLKTQITGSTKTK